MYNNYGNADLSYISGQLSSPGVTPDHSNIEYCGIVNDQFYQPVSTLMSTQEFRYTTTSSSNTSYGSSSSSTSYRTTTQIPSLMQRSLSSHSLQTNFSGFQFHQPTEFLDSDSSRVRTALSPGDLHGMNMVQQNERSESPLSNESCIIEGVSAKATRYTPEEKKEKIERYRSKRNQRNFNKKIKYVCRKTLADSRPRIRGRFARNDEIEKAQENEWSNLQTGCDHQDIEYYDENWIDFLDAISANLIS